MVKSGSPSSKLESMESVTSPEKWKKVKDNIPKAPYAR
jgi:hypothetical protein